MEKIIFTRDYSESCNDCDDMLFFGEFARSDELFAQATEKEIIEFSRFASRGALLAEQLRAVLTAYQKENSISFDISAPKFTLTKEATAILPGISRVSSVNIEYLEDKIHLKFEFEVR